MNIRKLQEKIKEIDYQPERKEIYILKLVEEIGELFVAIRKNKTLYYTNLTTIRGTIEEELYDVLYYLLAIANVYGVDMERAIILKNEFNDTKYDRK